jgi:hypothetical protein
LVMVTKIYKNITATLSTEILPEDFFILKDSRLFYLTNVIFK